MRNTRLAGGPEPQFARVCRFQRLLVAVGDAAGVADPFGHLWMISQPL